MDDKEIKELVVLAREAVELAEETIGYTPNYFRDKWHLDRQLADLKARLARLMDRAVGE